jgi:hypothetical protein
MDLLTSLGTAIWICGALALIARRIRSYQYDGLLAIAEGLFSIDALRTGEHLLAVFAAAMSALFAHRWWRGGGGDGTRRRLRALRRRFSGVRRTAPQPTS